MPGDFVQNDLAALFNLNDMGSAATYAGNTIKVLFTSGYAAAASLGIEVESARPTAITMAKDIAGVKHRDQITINSVVYYIAEIHNDGLGLATLILSKDK